MAVLEAVGFRAKRHERSVNLHRRSHVSLRLSAEDFYRNFSSSMGIVTFGQENVESQDRGAALAARHL